MFNGIYLPTSDSSVANSLDLIKEWWPERESNPRHEDFQSSALPTELSGHIEEARIKRKMVPTVNLGQAAHSLRVAHNLRSQKTAPSPELKRLWHPYP